MADSKPPYDPSKMDWQPVGTDYVPQQRRANPAALQVASDSSAPIMPLKGGGGLEWLPVQPDLVMPRLVNISAHVQGTATVTGRLANIATLVHAVPDLLVQAVIERVGQNTDGDIVIVLCPAFDAVASLLEQDPDALFKIDPRKFEEFVAGFYSRSGFEDVILTPRSGDLGRDIIATKRGLATIRIIDQVKRFSRDHLVTADDVRALVGVLSGEAAASKGVITTTSDFAPRIATDRLLAPLFPTRVELINGVQFRDRLARVRVGEKA